MTFDVTVIGLGVIGSACVRALARAGLSVLGVDRAPPNAVVGSSHGDSRMFRRAYPEGDDFVPLVDRALDAWRDLEREGGVPLFLRCGGLVIGAPHRRAWAGTVEAAERQRTPHQLLTHATMTTRFPQLHVLPDEVGYWEAGAGLLVADACVRALRDDAVRHSARLCFDARVCLGDVTLGRPPTVSIDGVPVRSKQWVVAVGSWLPQLAHERLPAISVERVVMGWFGPRAPALSAEAHPFVVLDRGERAVALVPDVGMGVKVGLSRSSVPADAEQMDPLATADERDALSRAARTIAPLLIEPLSAGASTYTDAPAGRFALGRLDERVVLACACSGHAFKMAPAIGDLVLGIVDGGDESHVPAPLRLVAPP